MTYIPPGHINYKDFFNQTLNSISERFSYIKEEEIKQLSELGGFFDFGPNFCRFYELDDEQRSRLYELLNNLQEHKNKTFFFSAIEVKALKEERGYDHYLFYKGRGSYFYFKPCAGESNDKIHFCLRALGRSKKKSYPAGRYCFPSGEYSLNGRENIEEIHYMKIYTPHSYQEIDDEHSFSYRDLIKIFYTNLVWKKMRDALCTSVKAYLSSNMNHFIEHKLWIKDSYWHCVLLNHFLRFPNRQDEFLFKQEEISLFLKTIDNDEVCKPEASLTNLTREQSLITFNLDKVRAAQQVFLSLLGNLSLLDKSLAAKNNKSLPSKESLEKAIQEFANEKNLSIRSPQEIKALTKRSDELEKQCLSIADIKSIATLLRPLSLQAGSTLSNKEAKTAHKRKKDRKNKDKDINM